MDRGDSDNPLVTTTPTTFCHSPPDFTTYSETIKNPPDQHPTQRFLTSGNATQGDEWPLFSYLMILFSILLFSGELLSGKESSGEFFELEPFNGMLGPSIEIMIQMGARFAPCMRPVSQMPAHQHYVCLGTMDHNKTLDLLEPVVGLNASCSLASLCGMSSFHLKAKPDQTYRLFTALFIHSGLIHLVIEDLILYWVGTRIERVLNSLRFSILFVGSGVFGHAMGSNLASPVTPFLGYSSSLFGLLGYLFVDLMFHAKTINYPIHYTIKLVFGTALMFMLGLLPRVDSFSHIGGLISGLLLSLLLIPIRNEKMNQYKLIVYVIKSFGLISYALILGFLVYNFNMSNRF